MTKQQHVISCSQRLAWLTLQTWLQIMDSELTFPGVLMAVQDSRLLALKR